MTYRYLKYSTKLSTRGLFFIELRLEKMEDNMLRQVKKGEGKSVFYLPLMQLWIFSTKWAPKFSIVAFYISLRLKRHAYSDEVVKAFLSGSG